MKAAAFFLMGKNCAALRLVARKERRGTGQKPENQCFSGFQAPPRVSAHPVPQACARTRGPHSLSRPLSRAWPFSRPCPPLPLLTPSARAPPGSPPAVQRAAQRLQRAEPSAKLPRGVSDPNPQSAHKVHHSLFCQILWSTKYLEFSFYFMDSNWSGYILMIFGANLSIIHIKVTNVINSMQLFKKNSTDRLIIFLNLVIMKVYF